MYNLLIQFIKIPTLIINSSRLFTKWFNVPYITFFWLTVTRIAVIKIINVSVPDNLIELGGILNMDLPK